MKLDLTGQKFNHLTVIEIAQKPHALHCECLKRKSHVKDLKGQHFGRLVVYKRDGTINRRAQHKILWMHSKAFRIISLSCANGSTGRKD